MTLEEAYKIKGQTITQMEALQTQLNRVNQFIQQAAQQQVNQLAKAAVDSKAVEAAFKVPVNGSEATVQEVKQ